jgi:NAD+ kinase
MSRSTIPDNAEARRGIAKQPRILVLTKRTSYGTLVEEEKDANVTTLIEKGDPTVNRMRRSHEAHLETVREVEAALEKVGASWTKQLGARTPIEGKYDLVMTVGGDGTLLAASHQLDGSAAILGVNSAPESSVGFFCGAKKGGVLKALRDALDGTMKRVVLSRMRVEINGVCVHARVLNEALYCHASPAATSRYILQVISADGSTAEEEQRSSGLWIGPAAGSTAAQRSAGGRVLPLSSTKIQFVVREPYIRFGVAQRMPQGLIDDGGKIVLLSKMRQAKMFLDGHQVVHDITIGDRVTFNRSDEGLTVLGLARQR